uniref:NADH dehydrogenase subunit 2 n=1 Tax=Poecilobdella javanica TaxID=1348077 RepID=UPI001F1454EA|nr:NADH dehydrogenase subunit 2 [Poecilobdella javanica]ULO25934.1 NADH dehydrogenase subunit 2 [Poecilobdella javanica]
MNFTIILFMSFIMLIYSTVMIISSLSWLMIWICLELNMFSFLPVIMYSSFHEEGAVKYFVVQALASSMMLFSIMCDYSNLFNLTMSIILLMSICMKIGSFPFYFWYPSVMKSMNWLGCMILSTWQKLGPLCIMIFYLNKYGVIIIISIINIMIGGTFGMIQSDLRVLMAYSSISHLGWMMSVLLMNSLVSVIYFLLYFCLVMPVFFFFMKINIFTLSAMFNSNKNNLSYLFSLMLLILSLSGLPPLSGFMPKLMVLLQLSLSNMISCVFMVLFSILSLYMYLNLFFSVFMFYYENMKILYMYNKMSMLMSIMLVIWLVPLLILL